MASNVLQAGGLPMGNITSLSGQPSMGLRSVFAMSSEVDACRGLPALFARTYEISHHPVPSPVPSESSYDLSAMAGHPPCAGHRGFWWTRRNHPHP